MLARICCSLIALVLAAPLRGQESADPATTQDSGAVATPLPEKPNIVLMVADDLGWADLACLGHKWHQTPRLDQLAKEGSTFRFAYAAAPNCAPSRASLMVGSFPPRHGIYTVGVSKRGKSRDRMLMPSPNRRDLPTESVSLAEALSELGYRTGTIGKWHLGDDPKEHGFEHNVAGNAKGHPPSYHSPYKIPNLEDGPEGEHLCDRMAREAVAFLEDGDERPFFLYLPWYAVHTPIQPPKGSEDAWTERVSEEELGDIGRNSAARYAALVEAMDSACGQVLDALDRLGRREDTLVIFTSDNGPHGLYSTAAPLKGSKGMLYEGGIRVPFLVRWPGQVPEDNRNPAVIHHVDLFPTLVGLAGGESHENIDGIDITAALRGEIHLPARDLHWHFPAYLENYRKKDATPWRTTPAGAMRRGRWKLIEYFEGNRLELYDLLEDPRETRNQARRKKDKTKELHQAMQAWRKETGAAVPSIPNPEYRARPQR